MITAVAPECVNAVRDANTRAALSSAKKPGTSVIFPVPGTLNFLGFDSGNIAAISRLSASASRMRSAEAGFQARIPF
jgi:hypothetical protein